MVESAPVDTISSSDGKIRLTIKGGETDEGDDIILAIPPSVWHTIKIEGFRELAWRLASLCGRTHKLRVYRLHGGSFELRLPPSKPGDKRPHISGVVEVQHH